MGESKERYELRKQLKILRGVRGSGTELVSIYIAPGGSIGDASNKLREEYGTASNIKSKTTRKNVQDSLEKITGWLKHFREAPKNGMAIFAGNVSSDPGRPDIKLFSIVPPEPIKSQFYRCDSTFVLDPLDEILAIRDTYGLLVMDGREATIASLRGKNTTILRRLHSLAHSKVRKGGQSARRYERLIEESIEYYYKRVGEAIDELFVHMTDFKGLIVGGPGPVKEDFIKMRPFNYQIKVLGTLDTGYTEDYGVQELMAKAEGLIKEQEAVKERQLVEKFMGEVVRNGLAIYGEAVVRKALEVNKVGTLLLSEELEMKRITYECSKCGEQVEAIDKMAKEFSHPDEGKMRPVKETDIGEELLRMAEDKGIEIEMVSTQTSEGRQFLNSFWGVGAFLRYR